MAEVLVKYTEKISAENRQGYVAQACTAEADDGLWEGWIEFLPDTGSAIRSPRETEQPNRDAVSYWAQGLTAAYLEGALARALSAP